MDHRNYTDFPKEICVVFLDIFMVRNYAVAFFDIFIVLLLGQSQRPFFKHLPRFLKNGHF
jgi:hypothetical protein